MRRLLTIPFVISLLLLTGCAIAETTAPCAAVAGQVATNAGSTTGGTGWGLVLGGGRSVAFNNVNLTIRPVDNGDEIVDVGAVCLSSITAWPAGGTTSPVAVVEGHTYVVRFEIRGGFAKFKVNRYEGGVLYVTFVPNL